MRTRWQRTRCPQNAEAPPGHRWIPTLCVGGLDLVPHYRGVDTLRTLTLDTSTHLRRNSAECQHVESWSVHLGGSPCGGRRQAAASSHSRCGRYPRAEAILLAARRTLSSRGCLAACFRCCFFPTFMRGRRSTTPPVVEWSRRRFAGTERDRSAAQPRHGSRCFAALATHSRPRS